MYFCTTFLPHRFEKMPLVFFVVVFISMVALILFLVVLLHAGDAVNLEACLPGTWKSNKPVKADRE